MDTKTNQLQSVYDLQINNFQIIRNAHLQFKPGLTLITGKSNHGKSSIIKALQQLIFNTSGTQFITTDKNQCTITLTHGLLHPEGITKAYEIQYTKHSTGTGEYHTYNGLTNNQQTYSKLGSSQLEPIKELTHIDKELNYNFWNQMDKPFLLSHTPREQFDLLQQSPHTQHLNNIQKQIVEDRKSNSKHLDSIQAQLDLINSQNQQFAQLLQDKATITKLYDTIQDLTQKQNQFQSLSQTLDKLNNIDLTLLQDRLTKLQNIPQTTHLQQTYDLLSKVQHTYNNLTSTVQPINQLQYQIQNDQTQIDKLKVFITSNFDTCPLCHQPMNIHN